MKEVGGVGLNELVNDRVLNQRVSVGGRQTSGEGSRGRTTERGGRARRARHRGGGGTEEWTAAWRGSRKGRQGLCSTGCCSSCWRCFRARATS